MLKVAPTATSSERSCSSLCRRLAQFANPAIAQSRHVSRPISTAARVSPLSSRLTAATAIGFVVGLILVGLRVNQQLALIPGKLEALIDETARQNADLRSIKAEMTRAKRTRKRIFRQRTASGFKRTRCRP